MADTAIGDSSGVSRRAGAIRAYDYIPGRLKAFPLSNRVSVAYAGRSEPALDAIGAVVAQGYVEANLAGAVEILRSATTGGEVEFLLAAHIDEPCIHKCWDGMVSLGQTRYFIGNPDIVPELVNEIISATERYNWGLANGCEPMPPGSQHHKPRLHR